MLWKLSILVLIVVCLVSFAWGRGTFFVRSTELRPHRNGLGPLGTIFGVLAFGVTAIKPYSEVRTTLSVCAIALLLGALVLFWATVKAFGHRRPRIAFSAGSPDELVLEGSYRFVRHPFYVSYMLFWLGVFVGSLSWLTALAPVMMGVLYYRAASEEERAIRQSLLGPAYESYSRASGMFIPRLGYWLLRRGNR